VYLHTHKKEWSDSHIHNLLISTQHLSNCAPVPGSCCGSLTAYKACVRQNLWSYFLLHFYFPYFMEQSQNADRHLLCRPCIFWKYCWTHWSSFISSNLIHNSYINYIKLNASTCFARHLPILRRSMSLIVHVCSLWYSHSLQVVTCREWEYQRLHTCTINPLNAELNPICYLLALLGAHHFLHVSRIRVKSLTFRLLMSYIYGAPILDVSRSHTTTHHSR